MENNYFFTFEGLDGCGKDTQLFAFAQALKNGCKYFEGEKHKPLWITNEPTMLSTPGKKINELKKTNTLSVDEATNLFIADRILHTVQHVNPRLRDGHVLSSRYDLSTYMFQGAQGASFSLMYDLHDYQNNGSSSRIPDITFVFDVPVDVAMHRIHKRGDRAEYFEKRKFQEKAKENLDRLMVLLPDMDGRTIININGNQPVPDVTREMLKVTSCYVKHM
ncbi:dTMP kinase [Candidatus Woesearchaeota archaeon]|nr:dTMP kinase [Candidatus Woesearchaeota archaeon]